MMKERFGLWVPAVLALFAWNFAAVAQQKIGWIDTQEIMKKFPDAVEAQSKIDALVSQWQGEISKLQNQFQQEANDYQKRRLILPEQAQVQEEQKLSDLQKQIVDLRNKRFGENGDLYQQQNAIMRPVQEKVLQAIQDVAKQGGYDYILDKSGQALLMYANDKYDVTQLVLDKLKIPTANMPGTTTPTTSPTTPTPNPTMPTTNPTTNPTQTTPPTTIPPTGQPTQQPGKN